MNRYKCGLRSCSGVKYMQTKKLPLPKRQNAMEMLLEDQPNI